MWSWWWTHIHYPLWCKRSVYTFQKKEEVNKPYIFVEACKDNGTSYPTVHPVIIFHSFMMTNKDSHNKCFITANVSAFSKGIKVDGRYDHTWTRMNLLLTGRVHTVRHLHRSAFPQPCLDSHLCNCSPVPPVSPFSWEGEWQLWAHTVTLPTVCHHPCYCSDGKTGTVVSKCLTSQAKGRFTDRFTRKLSISGGKKHWVQLRGAHWH